MITPLYQDHNSPDKLDSSAHAGLWFERFFNRYEDNWEIIKENLPQGKTEGKKDWINTITTNRSHGESEQLEQFQSRQQSLVTVLKGQSHRYKTDWNFVSGMGNPHPVENGFSWHPTLAVPFLAGPAVKGLVRAWVELDEDDFFKGNKSGKDQRLKKWFGNADKGEVAEQSGSFIFFDAIPDKPTTLTCDIMTPHMKYWYQNETGEMGANDIPADWHEPTPIPFLAVKEAQFVFSIAPRTKNDVAELEDVFNVLRKALLWLGAGAKTAAGYGYMTNDNEAFVSDCKERKLQEVKKWEEASQRKVKQQEEANQQQKDDDDFAEQIKNCTPFAKQYFTEAYNKKWKINKETIWQKCVLKDWLSQIEQQENEPEVVAHMAQLLEHYFPGILLEQKKPDNKQVKGKKKKEEKKKKGFKDNQIEMANRIRALQAKLIM